MAVMYESLITDKFGWATGILVTGWCNNVCDPKAQLCSDTSWTSNTAYWILLTNIHTNKS